MGQQSQQFAIFSRFLSKNQCSHAHILPKERQVSKKHIALKHILCQKKKTCILSKTLCSHVFFFKLNNKTHAVMPIFG